MGIYDPKSITAKYFNVVSGISSHNTESFLFSSLQQNFPNPFNPNTIIKYQLSMSNNVLIRVYDVRGNEIATLINQKQNSGSYSVEFDGSDLPSGIYFYSLLMNNNLIDTKKMFLIK